jgi:hypothetical protein
LQGQAPGAEQPAAKLIVEAPAPELLAKGLVSIQYRTENVRIMPVFGPAALAIPPRIGHLHITVDDAPQVWGNTSGEPVFIFGLPPGPHKIAIALADANHKVLTQEVVKFEVPRRPDVKSAKPAAQIRVSAPTNPPAKLIIDPLRPDQVAKGLAYIHYRTENLQIAPVFGPDALKITPRVGHLHVRLDDAPWGWTYASGQPVIVNGLSPGRHRIHIELADANHQALAHKVVEFEVPQR